MERSLKERERKKSSERKRKRCPTLPFALVAEPQNTWTVTLKSAKQIFENVFEPATGGNIFLDFVFKIKMMINSKTYLF